MDVNGTSFHLLLGERDWAACRDESGAPVWSRGEDAPTEWNADCAEITLRPLPFVFPSPNHDRVPASTDRRGADADRFGNVYWIDEPQTGVVARSVGTGRATPFWSSADPAACPPPRLHGSFGPSAALPSGPLSLAGLAVTEDHYLVIGCRSPAGLLCFDLIAGGPPTHFAGPTASFEPVDIARRPGGGVWVLDARGRVPRDPRPHLVWELERDFRVRTAPRPPVPPAPGAFLPAGAAIATPSPSAARTVTEEDAFAVHGEPLAIAAFAGGFVILERAASEPSSRLELYRERGQPPLAAPTAGRGIASHGHDMTVRDGVAYVADDHGNQAFAFVLSAGEGTFEAALRPVYFPMRLFAGKGLVAGPEHVLYDFVDGWIPLVHQPRARHVETAVVVTPVFDGRQPGCVWHRLFLDGCLEPGTTVTVWSAAADDPAALTEPEWLREPAPRARAGGIELPFAEALAGYDTHELLFQDAVGRHLRVKLELRGDGRATPRIRALRASFPRFSYLERYLPAVYREDSVSASFLDRFLANFEGVYTSIEDTIAATQVLLDPFGAPSEALDWLARWFDTTLDPAWDDATRRLYLRHAMDLFRRRGTLRGVELALRLGLEGRLDAGEILAGPAAGARRARVVEAFRSRRTPGVIWGDPTDLGDPRVEADGTWTPAQGHVALDRAYRAALEAAGEVVAPRERFPLARPAGTRGAVWERFAETTLGFVPSSGPAAPVLERAWRDFIARRYSNARVYNAAYGLVGGEALETLEEVVLPAELPDDGAPLLDWFEFSSVVLPMRRRAHRFTVLLPVPAGGNAPDSDPVELRRRAERIVELQKPAHTVFEVRFFWAAFRVGEARLGEDTLIELGSRAPELLGPLVLGREHIGETYLGGAPVRDRIRRQEPS
jgi:phage tail-like protein